MEEVKEVEKNEKVEKAKNEVRKSKKMRNIIIAIVCVIVVLVIVVSIVASNKSKYTDLDAEGIIKEMQVPEGYMGYQVSTLVSTIIPNTSRIDIQDSRIAEEKDNQFNAGMILVFDNESEAQLYKDYLDNLQTAYSKNFTEEQYGALISLIYSNDYSIINKNSVLILNSEFSEAQVKEYEDSFNTIVNECNYEQKNQLSSSDMDDLTQKSNTNIDGEIDTMNQRVAAYIKSVSDSIDSSISTAKKNFSTEDLAEAQDSIDTFCVGTIFNDKLDSWQSQITEVKGLIAKKQADDAAKAKQADIKARTKTLGTGTYTVPKDIQPGDYDCSAVSGNGNFVVTSSGTYYDTLKVNEVFGVSSLSFYTKKFNNLTLENGDQVKISGGLSVKFQAK
ncbi:MAG: hypothetical protein FWF46_07600 [Oscillospiraceae bacterium]|nr:hypothetical protein [Oscillospiraceae bacterium]